MPEYRRRFRKKLAKLNDNVEKLGNLVDQTYIKSIRLFKNYVKEEYDLVCLNTNELILLSETIENDCLNLLAMEQPVAKDLRFVENSIKIASHLKRMGKLSKNIADIAHDIDINTIPEKPLNFMLNMSEEVDTMITRSMRSFLNGDVEEASELEQDDDIVDDLFDEFLIVITDSMKEDPTNIDVLARFLLISRYLERLADRSESIGHRVLLMQGIQQ